MINSASEDERHYARLTQLSAPGQMLSRESPQVSVRNPRWYNDVSPTAERLVVHHQLKVPVEHDTTAERRPPRAIFTAGPPGAGKSSALAAAVEFLGGDRRYRIIDPDRIKDDLLRASLHDGSYHSWLMPDQVWQLHQAGERFHPRELASLVQVESGRVAGALRNDAIAAKADFVMEGTLQQTSHASGMLKRAAKAGYEITIVNVECTLPQAEQRCFERWRAGRHTALAAEADERRGWDERLGGRFVPQDFLTSCFDPQTGEPSPAAVARELFSAKRSGQLLTFRVPEGNPEPQLESALRWEGDQLLKLYGPSNPDPARQRGATRHEMVADALRRRDPNTGPKPTPRGWTPRHPPGRSARRPDLER